MFVPSVECAEPISCRPHKKFNSSLSRTFQSSKCRVSAVDDGIFTTEGVAAWDTLHLGGLAVEDQEFELAYLIHRGYFFDSSWYDSSLGLARRTVAEFPFQSDLSAQSPFENLMSRNLLDHNIFAIKYPEANTSTGGELTLGFVDEGVLDTHLAELPIVDSKDDENRLGTKLRSPDSNQAANLIQHRRTVPNRILPITDIEADD